MQDALVTHVAAGGVFVDVGASIGFFSLLGARLVVQGSGQRLTSNDIERFRKDAASGAFVSFRGTSPEQLSQTDLARRLGMRRGTALAASSTDRGR